MILLMFFESKFIVLEIKCSVFFTLIFSKLGTNSTLPVPDSSDPLLQDTAMMMNAPKAML